MERPIYSGRSKLLIFAFPESIITVRTFDHDSIPFIHYVSALFIGGRRTKMGRGCGRVIIVVGINFIRLSVGRVGRAREQLDA